MDQHRKGSLPGLHHLEQIEFEIVRFGDIPQDGVIGCLLAGFNLAKLHPGIQGSAAQHPHKLVRGHKVAAGGGGEIATPG